MGVADRSSEIYFYSALVKLRELAEERSDFLIDYKPVKDAHCSCFAIDGGSAVLLCFWLPGDELKWTHGTFFNGFIESCLEIRLSFSLSSWVYVVLE